MRRLAHTFPELRHGAPASCSEDVWELSRLAMAFPETGGFGFSQGATRAMHAVLRYAMSRGVRQFVTVTTVGVEKMLCRLGLDTSRLGPALQLGVERAVALRIELNGMTWQALEAAVALEVQA